MTVERIDSAIYRQVRQACDAVETVYYDMRAVADPVLDARKRGIVDAA